jgi:hypothetical protein
VNAQWKPVGTPHPVDGLADDGQRINRRTILQKDAPRHADDLALKRLKIMAHQRDPCARSIANVLKLRFLEIRSDPKGTRID